MRRPRMLFDPGETEPGRMTVPISGGRARYPRSGTEPPVVVGRLAAGAGMDFGADYSVSAQIGHGASSTVYRARSAVFARDVAIKVFHGSVDDERLRRSFARECAVLGSLGDHPHVTSVFGSSFTPDRRPYLVMTYCEGGSLKAALAKGPLPVEQVVAVGVAVADALAVAHSRGILHRDVKPHNILCDRYGVIRLADFGISVRAPAELTSAAATPAYAAPEVLLDHRSASGASDVYGLGATLYTLLSGQLPCGPEPGEADLHYLNRLVDHPDPSLPATIPPAVAGIVLAALAKDPAARPAADEFRDGLREAAIAAGLVVPSRLDAFDVVGSAPIPASPADPVPDPADPVPDPVAPADPVDPADPADPVTRNRTPARPVVAAESDGAAGSVGAPAPDRSRRRLVPVTATAVASVVVVAVVGYGVGRDAGGPTTSSTSATAVALGSPVAESSTAVSPDTTLAAAADTTGVTVGSDVPGRAGLVRRHHDECPDRRKRRGRYWRTGRRDVVDGTRTEHRGAGTEYYGGGAGPGIGASRGDRPARAHHPAHLRRRQRVHVHVRRQLDLGRPLGTCRQHQGAGRLPRSPDAEPQGQSLLPFLERSVPERERRALERGQRHQVAADHLRLPVRQRRLEGGGCGQSGPRARRTHGLHQRWHGDLDLLRGRRR